MREQFFGLCLEKMLGLVASMVQHPEGSPAWADLGSTLIDIVTGALLCTHLRTLVGVAGSAAVAAAGSADA